MQTVRWNVPAVADAEMAQFPRSIFWIYDRDEYGNAPERQSTLSLPPSLWRGLEYEPLVSLSMKGDLLVLSVRSRIRLLGSNDAILSGTDSARSTRETP